jgi:hypothetical protein
VSPDFAASTGSPDRKTILKREWMDPLIREPKNGGSIKENEANKGFPSAKQPIVGAVSGSSATEN